MEKDQKTLQQRLEALEAKDAEYRKIAQENERLKEEVRNQQDSSSRPPMRSSESACIGEGYLFEVSPVKTDSKLPTKKIKCCDESEAIRVYIVTTEDPDRPGRQVDCVKNQLKCKCVDTDKRRSQSVLRQKQIAAIRAKFERGIPLSDVEQTLLDQELTVVSP